MRMNRRTHRCTQAAIDLQYRKSFQVPMISRGGEVAIRDYVSIGWRVDAIPVPSGKEIF